MKKTNLLLGIAIISTVVMTSFDGGPEEISPKEVAIGEQVWMSKNLSVDKFRNGDPIRHVKSAREWSEAGAEQQPAWCYIENDTTMGKKYGKLYNWYAVNDPRGLAPKGWHIPSTEEWKELTDLLTGKKNAGKQLKNSSGWDRNGNGTNETGFSALPGGSRFDDGNFTPPGCDGNWWSSTEEKHITAWAYNMYCINESVLSFDKYKGQGKSIRCVRD